MRKGSGPTLFNRVLRLIMRLGLVIICALVVAVLIIAAAIPIYELLYVDRIYPGVSVLGLDLGGLRPEEAEALLERHFNPYVGQPLTLRYGERSWPVSPQDIGVSLDAKATAAAAYAVGRWIPIRESLRLQLEMRRYGHSIPPVFAFDEGAAKVFLSRLAREINRPVRDAKLTLRGLQVKVTPAQTGREVDIAATRKLLYERIVSLSGGEVELVVHETPPRIPDVSEAKALVETMIGSPLILDPKADDLAPWTLDQATIADMLVIRQVKQDDGRVKLEVGLDQGKLRVYVEEIARQIERAPKDAWFDFDEVTGTLTPIVHSREGRTLNVDEAMHWINVQVATANRVVVLPVITIRPKVADEDAPHLGIKELVSEATTSFKGSSAGRARNIQLAASRFHGLVIPPGEVFSFNEHLGEVSAEAGYEESLIIWGDRTRREPGGGICQVSTTVFRAAFWGGYPIVERHPHTFRVSWYEPPVGFDATVYPPWVDFKFQNDTPYHLLIETETDMAAGTVTFRFYSTKTGRTVEMEGPIEENVVPHGPPIYEEDPTLPKGTTKQVEWARDGVDVTIYRIIKQDGKVIKREKFFSRYKPWCDVFKVGTKEE